MPPAFKNKFPGYKGTLAFITKPEDILLYKNTAEPDSLDICLPEHYSKTSLSRWILSEVQYGEVLDSNTNTSGCKNYADLGGGKTFRRRMFAKFN